MSPLASAMEPMQLGYGRNPSFLRYRPTRRLARSCSSCGEEVDILKQPADVYDPCWSQGRSFSELHGVVLNLLEILMPVVHVVHTVVLLPDQ